MKLSKILNRKRITCIVILIIVGAASVFGLYDKGWEHLPPDAPTTFRIYNENYTQAGQAAALLLEEMRQRIGIPGATAAIAIDGKLIWAAGTGWADLSGLLPATPETLFRIGSTSKAVTATVLARLHDQGVLNVSDSVADHIDTPLNEAWGPIRLDQLMSHTAGFPGYENNRDWAGFIATLHMRGQFQTVEDGLRLVDGSRLVGKPGEQFYYSSFDVGLAALVAEHASKSSYDHLLHTTIREPLRLESPILANNGPQPPHVSASYKLRTGSMARRRGEVNVSQRWPGGGLYSRSADLVQLGVSWLDDSFLSPNTRALFWEPQRLNNGEVNEQNYALGWRVSPSTVTTMGNHPTGKIIHHGGVSRGAMSWFVIYPDLKLAVAININAETKKFSDFSSVEPKIVKLFAEAAEEFSR